MSGLVTQPQLRATLCGGVGGRNFVRDSCFGLARPAGESFQHFSRLPLFTYLWVQLLFLLLPPISSQLLRAGKDVTRFLPSRVLTLLFFYNAPSNLVYALETIQFACWLFFKLHLTHSS